MTKTGVTLPTIGVRYMTAEEAATIPAPKPMEPMLPGQQERERDRDRSGPFDRHR